MKNIVWLASYPKSGNTWFRIFISNLQSKKDIPIDINEIATNGIFSSNTIFERATGIDPNELTHEEADKLRPDVFRYYSKKFEELIFVKAHDAFTKLPNDEPIFPVDISFGAIYIIRNPFDVAVSLAYHNSKDVDLAVKSVNKKLKYPIKRKRFYEQLLQQLLSWSEHVNSWTTNKDMPILVLRYEDMKAKPLETFRKAIHFLNWEYSDEEISIALNKSSFNNLSSQESKKGFRERRFKQRSFFRKGIVGDWKNHLTEEQANQIIETNRETLERFNYLSGNQILI